jgi:hypothetical protein
VFSHSGREEVDWRELHSRICNVRLSVHVETKQNRVGDIDITVMHLKLGIETMNLGCVHNGDIREREGREEA